MVYKVKRTTDAVDVSSKWNEGPWQKANTLQLSNYMGQRPEHFPKTQAKLLYDDENIYVFFRVEDQYVRAVADETHSRVWEDSCVEFFFTPGPDIKVGYFNLETDCGGTMLFRYNNTEQKTQKYITEADFRKIEIFHSMPQIIEEEISEPTLWTLQYKLPLEVLANYCQINKPAPRVIWRANFYKCADKTSHPHWLTWSFVDNPAPDFHLPQYFGIIEFR